MATLHNIHLPDEMRNVSVQVRVTGTRRTRWRQWLAGRIVAFAALVSGCDIEVFEA